ncbi:hypothetical protein FPQ18DRAFT_307306 [Pyronema domesticum]|nr:hypothetical protein FPQ18DRAFT_307306 [Pyronema domesticum]
MGFARLPNEILLDIGHVCTVQSLSSLRAAKHYFHTSYPTFSIRSVLSDNPAGRAILNDWTSVLKRLLERGLDANTVVGPEERRKLLLHNAMAHAIKPAVKLLLEFGANLEAPDGMSSPLMLAYNRGDIEMVRLLLENGAKVDWPGKYWNLLHNTVRGRERPAVKVLLEFKRISMR